MKNIKLRENKEYLTLGQLLKIEDLISSGGEAKIFLEENEVLVNDEPENRRGRKLYVGDTIKIYDQTYKII